MKYIELFIKYLKVEKKYSDYTIKSYTDDLLELYDYTNDLLDITPTIVEQYLEYLYSRGIKRNSISRKLSSLRSFYQYLLIKKLVTNNYFKEVSNPKKNAVLPKYAKNDDLEKIFQCFDKNTPLGQRNALILEILYATGIRVSELVNIKLNDINTYDRTIKILGKGRKERIVIYGSYCEDNLNLYLKNGRNKLEKSKNDYLLLNKNGTKISTRYIRKIINDAVRKCEVDYKISPHTLRHTFATDMLNAGADLMTVKELLGHSSINTTSIYTHVTSEQIKKVYNFAHPRSK